MKYIIGAVVGAVIGYITNWLAIKMLFKPYTEKKVFGLKIPFTPGLIPKEQKRIAKSVGEAIGEHLLTTETITNALSNDLMKNHVRNWISEKLNALSKNTHSIREVMNEALKGSYESFKNKLIKHINSVIISKFRSEEAIESASKLFMKNVNFLLNKSNKEIIEYIQSSHISSKIENSILSFKEGKEFEALTLNLIKQNTEKIFKSQNTLFEVIPGELYNALKVYIYNSRYDIASELDNMLKQPKVQQQIRMFLEDSISSNFNPLIAKFISVDMLLGKLTGYVENYLQKDEGVQNVSIFIISVLDRISNKNIEEIIKGIPENSIEEVYSYLGDFIKEKIVSKKFVRESLISIGKSLGDMGTLEDTLNKVSDDWKKQLESYMHTTLEAFANSEELENNINIFVEKSINNLEELQIKTLFEREKEKIENISFEIIYSGVNKFIEKEAPEIIKVINIPKIVEDQVNSFEVDYAEKIILDIAHKELSAITWLGALLGGVLGVLSPILSSFY